MKDMDIYRELFELTGYMLTSARGLLEEPEMYGPFRLLDGVSRLCGIIEKEDSGYGVFFSELKAKIDEKKYTVMTDEDAFIRMMDDAVLTFTRKMKEV